MVDSRNAALVRFENVAVGPDAVLGPRRRRRRPARDGRWTEPAPGWQRKCSVALRKRLSAPCNILKDRKQFGVAIGSFQALKHRAAQMFCEVEITRSAVIAAVSALDQNSNDAAALVSLAKGKSQRNAVICAATKGMQMHGGIGMTDEHEIGFFMKRSRVAQASFGDTRFCRDRYAS